MLSKNKILITISVLIVILLNSAIGQSGTYYIPEELSEKYTESFLDSMRTIRDRRPNTTSHIDYNSLGNLMWYGGADAKVSSNTVSFTMYTCTENGWIKIETSCDKTSLVKEYEIYTPDYTLLGNTFWTETIDLEVIDNTEITINSVVDLSVEIYKANGRAITPISQLSVLGNGINQSFQVNLDNGESYIVVFKNSSDDIVNIKRIGV